MYYNLDILSFTLTININIKNEKYVHKKLYLNLQLIHQNK